MEPFKIHSEFKPTGDQPQAIDKLVAGIEAGQKHQVLLGVTGSGKTYTMANVIERTQRPALILAHNKTLAAQLYAEFAELFPNNAVEYFVSYYDYYQPEAYVPRIDTYIAKDAQINERIDKMRHSATRNLLEREDCIIIASVSCIYGLGSPEAYHKMLLYLERGMTMERDFALRKLTEILYKRSEFLERGRFRVRGDVIDIFPVYEDDALVRVEFFGDEVAEIYRVDSLTGEILAELKKTTIFPASHYVVSEQSLHAACDAIEAELEEQLELFRQQAKFLEAQRLEQRTKYDLELLRNIGTCQGIENYSRHMEGREAGSTPPTLMDYLPRDVLLFLDESHVTVPQVFGMYHGDRSRKETLVRHGFRLPSAMDNRPLKQEEFERIALAQERSIVYVSATPGGYELEKTAGVVVEQIVRPTGLADPVVEIRPARDQIIDVEREIKKRAEVNERTLVTTLTKRMAEDLADYLRQKDIRVRYMHADIETIERTEIIKDLRLGKFDCLIGINLLREGLDIPEVSLVAVLDADKEGFLRSNNSLIQTIGRAARNLNGTAILYADAITESMQKAIDETNRRRAAQLEYNKQHGITPRGIQKKISAGIEALVADADYVTVDVDIDRRVGDTLRRAEEQVKGRRKKAARRTGKEESLAALREEFGPDFVVSDIPKQVEALKKLMRQHAENLEFEKAAGIRDEIRELEQLQLELL